MSCAISPPTPRALCIYKFSCCGFKTRAVFKTRASFYLVPYGFKSSMRFKNSKSF